jgi:oligoendopeptidase F
MITETPSPTLETPRWTLDALIAPPVEPTLDARLQELEQMVAAFEQQRPTLSDDISTADFRDLLRQLEAVTDGARRLGAYARLWFTEDTQNPAALNMLGRLDAALTGMQNRMLFFDLWFKQLPDETAERLMAETGDLRYYLETLRRFRPHTLQESEEQIINLKDANGIDALVGLFDMLTSAYTYEVTVDGETRRLTRDQVATLYRHPSADVRAAAYQELFRVYESNSTVLSRIYNHRVRDWKNEVALRHFDQPIAMRNLANDLPDAVVDTLLDVARANNGVFQRYFTLKAGWLGVDKLRRYDIYAPLAPSDKTYPYGDAMEMVLDSLSEFSPRVAELAAGVFQANTIDAQVRPGKRGGAFCWAVSPGLSPYVMLNYDGNVRNVATMAHELGHAIHGLLAADKSPLTFHSSLPLAETASTFCEQVLTDRLLATETDPAVRRDVLAAALDDAYATVQRQAYFTLFEREAHGLINSGGTNEALCDAYLANLREQFGDAVEVSDDFRWEWISIPHFYHTPFYTYAYSFGQLLVLSLYRQYQIEGEPFVDKFLKLLGYGGSAAPIDILTEAGFDISTPEFWQGGYDVLNELITELEAL